MAWESPERSAKRVGTRVNANFSSRTTTSTMLWSNKSGSNRTFVRQQTGSSNLLRGMTIIRPETERILDSTQEYDHFFKVIVIGPENAGKSSLIRQYCSQEFYEEYAPTFGLQNRIKKVLFSDMIVQLSIWDTPSDERFMPNIAFHASSSDAIIFVYDSSDKESIKKLSAILEELSSEIKMSEANLYLISAKKDKRQSGSNKPSPPKDLITKYNLHYVSISTRSSKMVEELFEQMIETLVNKQDKNNEEQLRLNEPQSVVHSETAKSQDSRMKDETPKEKEQRRSKKNVGMIDSEGYWRNEAEDSKLGAPLLNSGEVKFPQPLVFDQNALLNQKYPPEPEPNKIYSAASDLGFNDTLALRSRKFVTIENEDNSQHNPYPLIIGQKYTQNSQNSNNSLSKLSCCSQSCNIF